MEASLPDGNSPEGPAGRIQYCKTGGVQVAITGTDKGQWSIQGKVAKRGNGQCIIGLPPGKYTIEFTDADGKTKPANTQVTVVAGEVATATGAYT